jgi:antitoxin component YwqK of YwqJK toxin-antitoxin module
MSKLKWTIKGNKEIVYQGTLKNMELFTGQARLEEKNVLYGEGECRAGNKVGPWLYYHENGETMSRETYDENGRKQGLSELFYDNGNPWSTTVYQNGKPVGELLRYYDTGELHSRSIYDTTGNPVSCQEYYSNGNLRLEQTFIAGRLSSEQRYQNDGTPW